MIYKCHHCHTRFERRKKTRETKPEVKDEKILELQRKLEERKEQRRQEQESAKIVPDKKSIRRLNELNASKVSLHLSWVDIKLSCIFTRNRISVLRFVFNLHFVCCSH